MLLSHLTAIILKKNVRTCKHPNYSYTWKTSLIQPDNLLPQIDGFNCGIHTILNTYYLLFPNTDKDNAASDYSYKDLAYKLKNTNERKIVTLQMMNILRMFQP